MVRGMVRPRVRASALFSWIFCVPKSHLCVGILNSRARYACHGVRGVRHACTCWTSRLYVLYVTPVRVVRHACTCCTSHLYVLYVTRVRVVRHSCTCCTSRMHVVYVKPVVYITSVYSTRRARVSNRLSVVRSRSVMYKRFWNLHPRGGEVQSV